MSRGVFYCVVYGGATYGCSRSQEEAVAALERGRKRGVHTAKIVTRSSRPNKQPPGWLAPFDERRAGFH